MSTKRNKPKNQNATQPEPTPSSGEGFDIQSGVPIPPRTVTRSSAVRDALGKMFSGDSVKVTKNQAAQFRNHAKKAGVKIATRREPDGSFRVWKQ